MFARVAIFDGAPASDMYQDPIATGQLAGYAPEYDLGAFPEFEAGGLGIFGIDDAIIAAAIPAITSAIGGVRANSQQYTDPVAAVWKALPASAIGAHVGTDGWWYDNGDNHKLSHDEAALRQQEVTAGSISARVDHSTGWWVDLGDGHQLTHAEAWQRYEALMNGDPIPLGPSSTAPVHPASGTPITFPGAGTTVIHRPTNTPAGSGGTRPTTAGIGGAFSALPMPVLLGGAAVVALLLMKRRR